MTLGLSSKDRKDILHRQARRNAKDIINTELTADLIDEEPDWFGKHEDDMELNEFLTYVVAKEKRRREDIIKGIKPGTRDSYTLDEIDEFNDAVDALGPLTPDESATVHTTWWSIHYYADIDADTAALLAAMRASDVAA